LHIESVGCFGRGDARPSAAHVALDAFAAAIAALVALDDVEPVRALLTDEPATGISVVAFAAVLASLAALWLRGTRASVAAR
jgi:hypothetical protein